MSKYIPENNPKIFSESEKNSIRNQWCDQLCHIFNLYFKQGKKSKIGAPTYLAQVLSTFDILDFGKIDFKERNINFGESATRTNNENLIFESFDLLISKKVFIGDLLVEFRNYFNNAKMPF